MRGRYGREQDYHEKKWLMGFFFPKRQFLRSTGASGQLFLSQSDLSENEKKVARSVFVRSVVGFPRSVSALPSFSKNFVPRSPPGMPGTRSNNSKKLHANACWTTTHSKSKTTLRFIMECFKNLKKLQHLNQWKDLMPCDNNKTKSPHVHSRVWTDLGRGELLKKWMAEVSMCAVSAQKWMCLPVPSFWMDNNSCWKQRQRSCQSMLKTIEHMPGKQRMECGAQDHQWQVSWNAGWN